MVGTKSPLEVYCEIMQKLCALRLSNEYAELVDADDSTRVIDAVKDDIKDAAEHILKTYDAIDEARGSF